MMKEISIKDLRLIGIILSVVLLLLVPLIAMQFTDQVNWSPADFMIGGVLLLGTGLMCELVIRKARTRKARITICAIIVVAFLLLWIEMAVGIFGTPIAGS